METRANKFFYFYIKLTKGGVLRNSMTSSLARLDHSCVRNALQEMVYGALSTTTVDVLVLLGFSSWRKALTCSNQELLTPVGGDPIRQLDHNERNFGWMAAWEMNPKVFGSLWLMAYANWEGNG
jgi:hypothetical protein